MKTNYFIYYQPWAVVFIITIGFLGVAWAQQFNLIYPIMELISIGILLKVIDCWLWKYPPFSWMFTIKDFSGTYEGVQHCFFIPDENKDKACNEKQIFMDVTMIIVQTGSSIVVNAFYKHHKKESSNSHSDLCIITKTKDKQHFQILYHYTNEGNKVEKLDEHFGTSILKIIKGKDDYVLKGNYYTNRLPFPTRGKFLNLKRVTKATTHPI